jgi:hypothetical protein
MIEMKTLATHSLHVLSAKKINFNDIRKQKNSYIKDWKCPECKKVWWLSPKLLSLNIEDRLVHFCSIHFYASWKWFIRQNTAIYLAQENWEMYPYIYSGNLIKNDMPGNVKK